MNNNQRLRAAGRYFADVLDVSRHDYWTFYVPSLDDREAALLSLGVERVSGFDEGKCATMAMVDGRWRPATCLPDWPCWEMGKNYESIESIRNVIHIYLNVAFRCDERAATARWLVEAIEHSIKLVRQNIRFLEQRGIRDVHEPLWYGHLASLRAQLPRAKKQLARIGR